MQSLYASGPTNVPSSLTAPSSSFKRHVLLAVLGLLFFVVVYLGLMVWFGYLTYNIFTVGIDNTDNTIVTIVAGICLGFLCIFMLKSLFIFSKSGEYPGKELKQADEPVLFDFLYKLADEAGAPRPHRVFLSSRVNASVFYDLSILNLILPSKKNLEIGLGLVNVLNIGETKAVLAHEFGHFAQRSMMLGRYVYTAQQIAVRVVHKRDGLDKLVSGISHFDLRVAWVGWILSVLIWAMRALIESIFMVVSLAEKALSREMEFQADLVAASLTGSDALVHALHRLRAADEGYHAAMGNINERLGEKKAVEDLFALQTNYIEKMRWVLNSEDYGSSPKRDSRDGEPRVFNKRGLEPPEMWSTHPADNDREDNLKRTYIYAEIDERSSWALFSKPEELRKDLTKELIDTAKAETSLLASSLSVEAMNEDSFSWTFLDPKYRGNFFGRFPYLSFVESDTIYKGNVGTYLKREYAELYPASLNDMVEHQKELEQEIQALITRQNESLTAEKRLIMHRGQRIKRSDIPDVLTQIRSEEQTVREQLMAHDKRCRSVNYQAALKHDVKIAEYLASLNALVHYAEHTLRDLQDARGKFNNTLQVVLADGRVSSSERSELLRVAFDVNDVLGSVFERRKKISLDKALIARIGGKPYTQLFEDYKMGTPDEENIGQWIDVVDSWIEQALDALSKLRNACLERILDVEMQLRESTLNDKPLDIEVGAISTVTSYKTMEPGKERELQLKLDSWDRFHSGDGLIPSIAKFAVAAALIGVALYAGNYSQHSTLYMYNGFAIPVEVSYNGSSYEIDAEDYYELSNVQLVAGEAFVARTADGELVDEYEPTEIGTGKYVYNIGRSGVFTEYTVYYGGTGGDHEIVQGAAHWISSTADHILSDPPESITTSGNSSTRDVLGAVSGLSPSNLLASYMNDEEDAQIWVENHAKLDPSNAEWTQSFLMLSTTLDSNRAILHERYVGSPNDVVLNRVMQEISNEQELQELCSRTHALAQEDPDNADLRYLSIRCLDDGPEKERLFIEAQQKFPESHWLSYAAAWGYTSRENWEQAYRSYAAAISKNPSMLNEIAPLVERIRKTAMAQGVEIDKYELDLHANATVNYYRHVESGHSDYRASLEGNTCYHLHVGNVEDAFDMSKRDPDLHAAIRWNAAASDLATESMISEVLNTSDTLSGISSQTIWSAIGLYAKHNKDYKIFIEVFSDYVGYEGLDGAMIGDYVLLLKQGNISAAQAFLDTQDHFEARAYCESLAAVMLGADAPSKWRFNATHLLYMNERPFFELPGEE